MTKKVYLLRHCAIPENELGINGSRTDSALSENGQKGAIRLVAELSKYKFDLIIVSPLKRTLQTITPYLDSLTVKPELTVESLTIERDLGDLTNTKSGDGQVRASREKQNASQTAWVPENGESTLQVGKRAKEFLKKIEKRQEKSILICGHQNFLRCLELVIEGKPIDDANFYSDKPPRLGSGEIRILEI